MSTDADRRAVKKAYFSLCREFHPDRYFRREIGLYAEKLDGIFKRAHRPEVKMRHMDNTNIAFNAPLNGPHPNDSARNCNRETTHTFALDGDAHRTARLAP